MSSNQTGYVTSMVLTDNSGSAFTQKIHVDTRPAPLQVAKEKTLQNANDILKTPLTNNKHAEELISSPMSPKSLLTTKVYWSWIPIIGAVVSAKETYSERKKERKETKEKEKLEKENEKQ